MNIHTAKEEIARTFRAYTLRNPDGTHRIPVEKQRPILLIGPPGIGKTAIMKQIARELDCGLVAYAMTHHTRQSAIGLPYIAQKEYGGKTVSVTEYTMSEIVAAIYDYMADTGKSSGILFLDEINCVSETLTPVMLQLLQSKTFGSVSLPEDWIIVAAGNPPEYNQSVHEFDMVTLDRVKHIEIEADLKIWQRYALRQGIHPAIRTYLSVFPDHFYKIHRTDRGLFFVTARGWEDLSLMLSVCEDEGLSFDADWFLQYLQYDEIARSFGLYYDLFRHFTESVKSYEDDFSLSRLLLSDPEGLANRSATECLAIAAMLFHAISTEAEALFEQKARLNRRSALKGLMPSDISDEAQVRAFFEEKRRAIDVRVSHRVMKPEEELQERAALDVLEEDLSKWRRGTSESFPDCEEKLIDAEAQKNDESAKRLSEKIEEGYRVLTRASQGRSAVLYFTSDLAASKPCGDVLSAYPSEAFERYRKEIEPASLQSL